jgi:2-polyprenyl-6-methoxyphenol hydroxylase-like FAD-dependent oxidoreductase
LAHSADRRALVIGGSMSGLFAAILLRRAGWDVHIYERVDVELTGRGAGIVTHAEMRAVLRAAGCDPSRDLGVEVASRRTLDRYGRIVGTYACPQTLTSWDRVFRMLREVYPADRYHLGKELVRIEQQSGAVRHVVAHFADGSHVTGDLLVGADGFRSTVRARVLPEVRPVYAGYCAWRGLIDECALSPATHADIFDAMVFCLPPAEQFISYPIAGPDNDLRAGHRRCNFVWYRPAEEASALTPMLTDASGRTHMLGISPQLIRPEVVAGLHGASRALLAPQLDEVVRNSPQPFLQPIYDVESQRMAVGRVAILGDAAFLARPHVAAGVTKAAEDAMALARALRSHEDVDAALAAFERARIPVNCRIMARGRELGACLGPPLATPEERTKAERHHTPEAVMSEIAVLDFLPT